LDFLKTVVACLGSLERIRYFTDLCNISLKAEIASSCGFFQPVSVGLCYYAVKTAARCRKSIFWEDNRYEK